MFLHLQQIAHEEDHAADSLESTQESAISDGSNSATNPLVPTGPVRCIVCSSDPRRDGEACITRPRDFLQDCITPPNSGFGPYTGCRRIEQWVEYDLNSSDPLTSNYHRIIRQCAYFGNLKRPCQKDNNLGGRQHVCYCQGEACNHSSINPVINSYLLLIFVSVSIFFILLPEATARKTHALFS